MSTNRTTRSNPTIPLGPYPQLRAWGQAGNAPSRIRMRITKRAVVTESLPFVNESRRVAAAVFGPPALLLGPTLPCLASGGRFVLLVFIALFFGLDINDRLGQFRQFL